MAMLTQDKVRNFSQVFPGPLVLRGALWPWALLSAILFIVAIAGLAVALTAKATQILLCAWSVWVIYGSLGILAAAAMMPGLNCLKLDRNGFETRLLWARRRYGWAVSRRFYFERSGAMRFYCSEKPPPLMSNWVILAVMVVLLIPLFILVPEAAGFGGGPMRSEEDDPRFNAKLSASYGLSSEEMARLLSRWRELAVGNTVYAD